MANQKGVPLSLMLENAKRMTVEAVQDVLNQTKLPAYLYEGILIGVLSDIREQKNQELMSDINLMNQDEEQEEREEGEE